jgi:hypothetical protein
MQKSYKMIKLVIEVDTTECVDSLYAREQIAEHIWRQLSAFAWIRKIRVV